MIMMEWIHSNGLKYAWKAIVICRIHLKPTRDLYNIVYGGLKIKLTPNTYIYGGLEMKLTPDMYMVATLPLP